MVFVIVVVGGLGSLGGAMLASVLIGVITSLAVGVDRSIADLLAFVGARSWAEDIGGLLTLKVSSLAATIPFALMLFVLLVRPRGLMGEEA
jgi:branched-chain amino acid transport system permease protein